MGHGEIQIKLTVAVDAAAGTTARCCCCATCFCPSNVPPKVPPAVAPCLAANCASLLPVRVQVAVAQGGLLEPHSPPV